MSSTWRWMSQSLTRLWTLLLLQKWRRLQKQRLLQKQLLLLLHLRLLLLLHLHQLPKNNPLHCNNKCWTTLPPFHTTLS